MGDKTLTGEQIRAGSRTLLAQDSRRSAFNWGERLAERDNVSVYHDVRSVCVCVCGWSPAGPMPTSHCL